MHEDMKRPDDVDVKSLKAKAVVRMSMMFLILGSVFFLSAGTLSYWQGWAYILVLSVPMTVFGITMFKHNPKFLARRMRTKETRKSQKLIQTVGLLPYLATYILPGFDVRFGWSRVPSWAAVMGLALVLLGYLAILYVFKTNSFASRVVEVEKEQRVITTGPYALVRHPMYSALIVLFGATPLALGSYWALLCASVIVPILVFRIKDEEKELLENLRGYREYTQRVRYRLVPAVW